MDALTPDVFHSTKARFDPTQMQLPAYFSDDRRWTNSWGSEVVSAKLRLERPYVCENEGMHFEQFYDEEFVAELKSEGFDSAILRNDGRPTIFIAFSQDQIVDPKFDDIPALPAVVMAMVPTVGTPARVR